MFSLLPSHVGKHLYASESNNNNLCLSKEWSFQFGPVWHGTNHSYAGCTSNKGLIKGALYGC